MSSVPEKRASEQQYNTERKKSVRSVPEKRASEQLYNTERKKSVRSNPERRGSEQRCDTERRKSARLNSKYSALEQYYNTISKMVARKDYFCRIREQMCDTERRKQSRNKEKNKKTSRKRQKRNEASQNQQQTIHDATSQFHKEVEQGPVYVCCVCNQLWYRYSVVETRTDRLPDCEAVYICVPHDGERGWLCNTCSSQLKKKKILPCSAANGMGFPNMPDKLKDKHQLEWRLMSPRIPFMNISIMDEIDNLHSQHQPGCNYWDATIKIMN